MTVVEQEFQRRIQALTPAEKFERMHHMLSWVRELYARQLREKLGDVSEERLKWEVALRMYDSDRQARELIERRLRDVPS